MMAADSWHQSDSIEQRLYTMAKELDKISEGRFTYLQNDTEKEKVSIHMLNDDCLRHIFQFLSIIDRVRIERVCKRWRDLNQDSWHMVKTLDVSLYTWGLDMRHFDMIHTALYKILLKRGKFLTRINVDYPINLVSDCVLTIIGRLCPNLTNFTAPNIAASGIRILANNCKNITKFKLGSGILSPCNSFHLISYENELEYLFKLHQNLEYFAITGRYNDGNKISGKCLLYLPEQTVHTIILDGCHFLQDDHLSMALKKLENLKHLAINCFTIERNVPDFTNFTDIIESTLTGKRTLKVIGQHCKNLKTLELGGLFSAPDMLYNLIHLVNLQVLKITHNSEVSDDFLIDLVQHCQQLSSIDITGCSMVKDAGLSAIATLVRLEKLTVNRIRQITDDGLKKVCGLKELECQRCLFSDQGMTTLIKSSPQLQLLDLSGCEQIGETILRIAREVCSSRTNNVMLKMIIGGTKIRFMEIENQFRLPSLLHILNLDLSIFSLRGYMSSLDLNYRRYSDIYLKKYKYKIFRQSIKLSGDEFDKLNSLFV